MKKFYLDMAFISDYKGGQEREQRTRYTLTGERCKADNVPYNKGTDCLHYQIKSARATVCKGLDLIGYINQEVATEFIYATQTDIAFIMSQTEYIEFCLTFGTVTRESEKNGGGEKIRLKSESKALLQWLTERAKE